MDWSNLNFGLASNSPPSPEQAISPKRTRHPSLEPQPAVPTGQEILAQLDELTEEYALNGNEVSTIGGGHEGRTNASDSRPESSSLGEGAQPSGEDDDRIVAASPSPLNFPGAAPPTQAPPTPAPPTSELPTPVPHSATPTLSLALPPALPSTVEAPVSSRLRTRPERSQKWKASMGLVPNQEEGQSKKRKAPKEGDESAKRAKTVVEATTTATRKKAGARNAGAKKRIIASKLKAAPRVEFPNLIIPNASSSPSRATPPQSRAEINSTNNAMKQRTIVPGSSSAAGAAKAAGKKAEPGAAAVKKRAREEVGEDGHTSPAKKIRVTKAPKAPKPKKTINHAPTQKLDVFVCGEGSSGELGLGNSKTAIDVKRPRLNQNLSASEVGVVHVAVGGMHAAALTHDGLIYTWGVNDNGALGRDTRWVGGADDEMDVDGDDTVDLNPLECTPMPIPREHFPLNTVFTQLACGDSTTFAVTDDGEVWGWGTFRSNDGILGFSKDIKIQSTPTKLPNLRGVKQVVCGANHAMALKEDGTISIWGSGEQNQLGHRVLERKRCDFLLPTPLRLNKKCRLVGCGLDHSFAVEKNKEDVWTWGLNSFGETGIREGAGGNAAVVFSPTRVPTLVLNGDTISTITGGAHHSAATTANGKLLVWGCLDGCQLGLDTNSLPDTDIIKDSSDKARILIRPTEVPNTTIGTTKLVAVGTDHNVAINTAGQAHSWGFNVNYQCGQGAGSDEVDEPTRIENTAVKNRDLIWAGAGGQFSIMAAVAERGDGPE